MNFGFWIANFGFGAKRNRRSSPRLPDSFSDNRKSEIQNPKWLGLSVIAIVLVVAGTVAEAQQTGKILRIGFLDNSTASGSAVLIDAFRQELSKLGWIEGKNIIIEYRFAEQKRERLPELAAELVRLKVDVIVVTTGPTAVAAKKATTTIPIMITTSVDPVGEGLVASLARPGGNVTGLSAVAVELNTKRLEILKDAVPKLTRVGLLRPTGGGTIVTELQLQELRPAALAPELEEIETPANNFESALQTAKQKRVNAITMTASRNYFAERKRIVELAAKHRLTCNLSAEGICRSGRSHVLRR